MAGLDNPVWGYDAGAANPLWTGTGRLRSIQGLPTQSCLGMVETPHGVEFSFLSFRCRKIGEAGSQQLLLDTQAIKGLLLELPSAGTCLLVNPPALPCPAPPRPALPCAAQSKDTASSANIAMA